MKVTINAHDLPRAAENALDAFQDEMPPALPPDEAARLPRLLRDLLDLRIEVEQDDAEGPLYIDVLRAPARDSRITSTVHAFEHGRHTDIEQHWYVAADARTAPLIFDGLYEWEARALAAFLNAYEPGV